MIRIVKWEKHQHYKDRNPPWIKLHRGILNDRAFMLLAPASKALLVLLWVLAAENNGAIVFDPEDIAFRLRMTSFSEADLEPLILAGFLTVDSALLADCKQDGATCPLETETETETETEKEGGEKAKTVTRKTPRFTPPRVEDVEVFGQEQGIGGNGNAQAFHDHFTSNGWKVGGKAPMKDWQAAYRNWCRRDFGSRKTPTGVPSWME